MGWIQCNDLKLDDAILKLHFSEPCEFFSFKHTKFPVCQYMKSYSMSIFRNFSRKTKG